MHVTNDCSGLFLLRVDVPQERTSFSLERLIISYLLLFLVITLLGEAYLGDRVVVAMGLMADCFVAFARDPRGEKALLLALSLDFWIAAFAAAAVARIWARLLLCRRFATLENYSSLYAMNPSMSSANFSKPSMKSPGSKPSSIGRNSGKAQSN